MRRAIAIGLAATLLNGPAWATFTLDTSPAGKPPAAGAAASAASPDTGGGPAGKPPAGTAHRPAGDAGKAAARRPPGKPPAQSGACGLAEQVLGAPELRGDCR